MSPLAERINAGCTCNRVGLCRRCQDAATVQRLVEAAEEAISELYRVSPSFAAPKLRAAVIEAIERLSSSDGSAKR